MEFLRTYRGGSPDLETIRKLTISAFRAYLSHLDGEAELTARSRARKLSSLKAFFKFLERSGHGRNTAVAELKSPRFKRAPPRPVGTEAALGLAELAGEHTDDVPAWLGLRDRALLLLMYGAGLRISEALGVKVSDAGAQDALLIRGKGGKERRVPLLPAVRDALADYCAALPFTLKPSEPVFRGVKGGPLSPRLVQRRIAEMRGGLGLAENATPHALRHTFATDLLRAGCRFAHDPGASGSTPRYRRRKATPRSTRRTSSGSTRRRTRARELARIAFDGSRGHPSTSSG